MAPRKPREIIGDLFDWQPMTSEEVEAELAEAAVDVPAFLAKVREKIQ